MPQEMTVPISALAPGFYALAGGVAAASAVTVTPYAVVPVSVTPIDLWRAGIPERLRDWLCAGRRFSIGLHGGWRRRTGVVCGSGDRNSRARSGEPSAPQKPGWFGRRAGRVHVSDGAGRDRKHQRRQRRDSLKSRCHDAALRYRFLYLDSGNGSSAARAGHVGYSTGRTSRRKSRAWVSGTTVV